MKSKEAIRKLEKAGWVKIRQTGSHAHFRHPDHPECGLTTVPVSKREMTIGVVKSIEKRTGLKLS